jgi:hypothetical protein
MPLSSNDKLVLDQALAGQSVPTTLNAAIYQAIDAAGFEVTPSGGNATAIVDSKPGTSFRIDGFPGHYLKRVEVSTGVFASWIEIVGADGAIARFAVQPH